jgi:Undecaprenyl-phosphate glucose phosphotransferase
MRNTPEITPDATPSPAPLAATQGAVVPTERVAETPAQASGRNQLRFDLAVVVLRLPEAETLLLVSYLVALANVALTPAEFTNYFNATMIGVFAYAGLAEIGGAFDVDIRFSVRRSWSRVLTSWLTTGMFMLTLSFLLKVSQNYSRGWAIAWFVAGGFALCATRTLGVVWMRRLKRRGMFNHRVAIFGAGEQGERLARYIAGDSRLTITIVGFFDDRGDDRLPPRQSDVPRKGNLVDLVRLIRQGDLDQVIVALPWSAESRLQAVVAELAVTPVRIRLAPDLASFAFAHGPVALLGDLPVLTLFERPISGFEQLLKRYEDILAAIVLLALLAPVMLLSALAIKLDDGGPVFFRQTREGFNKHIFRIWKFRTMRAEACETGAIHQATRNDGRITRVGRILRRTSLDELPQLFNVLAGEMSMVGPRPHAPSTRAGDRLFSEIVKTYAARHNVKPGITGWAQVSGWRGETDTEEKLLKRLEHDLYYIENWSLLFDLYIMLRTGATVLFSRAAY